VLHTKIKNRTEEDITFEVLTRSALNYKEFTLDKYTFNEIFASSKLDMINTNISNDKANIYKCIDKTFETKLNYWVQNIKKITPLYISIYESGPPTSSNIYELDDHKTFYRGKFECDGFTFNRDFKFYRELFSTATSAKYTQGDFMYASGI